MVKLFPHSPETALDITKAIPKCQLGESHTQELIIACKRTDAVVTAVTIDAMAKLILRKEIDYLRKYSLAFIHGLSPFTDVAVKKPRKQAYGKFKSISSIFVII